MASPTSSKSSQRNPDQPEPEQEYESEFCWVLHTKNASKRVATPIRDRFAGQYGDPKDTKSLKTWNIQTICKEFLVAVPLWADVSLPLMTPTGESSFEDSMGGLGNSESNNGGLRPGLDAYDTSDVGKRASRPV